MELRKNLFVCFCMIVISGSLGFTLWATYPISITQAGVAAALIFTTQITVYVLIWKSAVYNVLAEQTQKLSVAEADNSSRLERLTIELANQRQKVQENSSEELEPLISELEVISTLVKQLAENSVDFDLRLTAAENLLNEYSEEYYTIDPDDENPPEISSMPAEPSPIGEDAILGSEVVIDEDDEDDVVEESSRVRDFNPDEKIVKAVNDAVASNQVDIYLQPIVSLPDRKPVYYEALSRLRSESGELIRPSQYVNTAELTGNMPLLDKMQLIRAIQVLRRLTARKSDAVIVCNISVSSLGDVVFFDDFRKLLRAKEELVHHMIFEFSQKTVMELGAIEEESLRALKALGFVFAMDNVTDLSIDYQRLARLGFQYMKVRLPLLSKAKRTGINDIHVDDFSEFLNRIGIQLIAGQIETEAEVAKLTKYKINLAQGFLFGGPREVRASSLTSTASAKPAQQSRLAS